MEELRIQEEIMDRIHSISELNAVPHCHDSHKGECGCASLEEDRRSVVKLGEEELGTRLPFYPRLKKLSDGSEEIADALRQGHIAYVINTRDIASSGTESDGHQIRRLATDNNVTIFTALDTVRVLLDVLEETTLTISTIDA